MVEKTVLEAFTLAAQTRISASLIEDFGEKPTVDTYAHLDFMSDSLCLMIKQKIWGKQLKKISVRYPCDWWQAVKERFAPKWFKRRWPVEYSLTKVDVVAFYPLLAAPVLDSPGVIVSRIIGRGCAHIEER